MRRQRSVLETVALVRGVGAWVDGQIARGRTDDEIVAMAPVAIAFINGDISLGDLERVAGLAREERRAASA